MDEGERQQAVSKGTDWANAVDAMTKLTKSGEMKWQAISAEDAQISSSDRVLSAYGSDFAGKRTRLLELERPQKTERPTLSPAWILPQREGPSIKFSLVLVDENDRPLFTIPESGNMAELLRAIKYQLADIEGYLEALYARAS